MGLPARNGSLRGVAPICLLLLMASAESSCTQKKEPEAAVRWGYGFRGIWG